MSVTSLEQFRPTGDGSAARLRRNATYWRLRAGLTQKDIVVRTQGQVSSSTISNIERTGKAQMESLDLIAEAIGVDISKLFVEHLPKDAALVLEGARGQGRNHSSTPLNNDKNNTRDARNVIRLLTWENTSMEFPGRHLVEAKIA